MHTKTGACVIEVNLLCHLLLLLSSCIRCNILSDLDNKFLFLKLGDNKISSRSADVMLTYDNIHLNISH